MRTCAPRRRSGDCCHVDATRAEGRVPNDAEWGDDTEQKCTEPAGHVVGQALGGRPESRHMMTKGAAEAKVPLTELS
jgi:hypothetical protein